MATETRTSHPTTLLARLAAKRHAEQEILLSVDGTTLIIADDGSYQQLAKLIDRLETIAAIRAGLADVDEGRTAALEDFKAEVQRRHGISS